MGLLKPSFVTFDKMLEIYFKKRDGKTTRELAKEYEITRQHVDYVLRQMNYAKGERNSNTGYIALYDRWGDILQSRGYNNKDVRREIIYRWQKMYGPRWCELTISILPDISEAKLARMEKELNQKAA